MAQFEEDETSATEENDETVPENPKLNPAAANREVVARRRRIEEVVEGKRSRVYSGDYDFDLE